MYKYIIIYLHFKQNEEVFIIMKIAISNHPEWFVNILHSQFPYDYFVSPKFF